MRPLLLDAGGIQVHSYYVLWTFALCLAVVLTRKRMTGLYGVQDNDARVIIALSFIGMILGARAGSAIEFREMYSWRDIPEEFGDLAAGFLLDFFLEQIAPHIYNQGVYDAYKYMNERTEDLLSILKL